MKLFNVYLEGGFGICLILSVIFSSRGWEYVSSIFIMGTCLFYTYSIYYATKNKLLVIPFWHNYFKKRLKNES